MKPIDYGRSYYVTLPPADEIRFAVESRTRIIDDQTGESEDYLQAASCKCEDSFVESGIFREDNYDFLPIRGPTRWVVFRRHAWLNPNYREIVGSDEALGPTKVHLPEPAYEELIGEDAAYRATLDFRPLVAQTEIWNADQQLRAVIEYPIKTMNTVTAAEYSHLTAQVDNPMTMSGEGSLYQIDTGPIAFADLSQRSDCHAERLSLAFVGFNSPHAAEFIIEAPTAIREAEHTGRAPAQTRHYIKRVRLTARNRIYAMI
ncbi:MAG: hypothetical protein CMJ49_02180 [Planctomycetaceae bacterium]|nr:hypothetical protein [Planctomycetaceae bacterium]